MDRHEGGFFDRLAAGLAQAGVAALQLDLRAHGDSAGQMNELTLSGIGNDIRAALIALSEQTTNKSVSLVGASFSGGVCATVAARHRALVDRLVLINPLLDYKTRFIDEKEYWRNDYIKESEAARLTADGYIEHSPTFHLGRALLNEVFWWNSRGDLPQISAPTLIVHGTKDTFIPVESSRTAAPTLTCQASLLEIDGAQHGIAVHDDPGYSEPLTRRWQSEAIDAIARWLAS